MAEYLPLLEQGVAQIEGLALDNQPEKLHAMLNFLALLEKWNRTYNLTSITDWRDMVIKHLLDSLIVGPFLAASSDNALDGAILDVGTGAGLPGIPLAIQYPNKHFVLLDSNNKKTRFLNQVKSELGLHNVTVVHDRIEHFASQYPGLMPHPIHQVVCRAYSSLNQFIEQTVDLSNTNETANDTANKTNTQPIEWLALKGQLPQQEITAFQDTYSRPDAPVALQIKQISPVTVPFLDEQRHLIHIGVADTLNETPLSTETA